MVLSLRPNGVRSHERLFWPVAMGLMMVLAGGCSSTRTYDGLVVDAASSRPLVGISVSGAYLRRGAFAPSLDGFFLRETVPADAVTDDEGRFRMQLGGFSRRIAVYADGYEAAEVPVDHWPSGKGLVIELHRIRKEK